MSLCHTCRVKRESERLSLAEDALKGLQRLDAEARQSSISSMSSDVSSAVANSSKTKEEEVAGASTAPPGEEESDSRGHHSSPRGHHRFGHYIHSLFSRFRHPIHGSSHHPEMDHRARTFNELSIDLVKDTMGWLLRHTKSRHALIVGGGLMVMNTILIKLGIPEEVCRCIENNGCFLYTLFRKMNLIIFCS